ncbi:hypothetical protein AC579_3405 [Pseudocercospora musae]|uniref:Uncharacterized protein n=1 Tax=Pseudocercospora musae TaxID=113226 RepID=A0A139ILV4_9PEZI|nr:hypothetical protein AC579_3405 [Pseudocercospora musae]
MSIFHFIRHSIFYDDAEWLKVLTAAADIGITFWLGDDFIPSPGTKRTKYLAEKAKAIDEEEKAFRAAVESVCGGKGEGCSSDDGKVFRRLASAEVL